MLITSKREAKKIYDDIEKKNMSMAVFCTASHWNTEAVLLAAHRFAKKHGIKNIPVSLAITFNYSHMAQAQRITRTKDAITGFKSIMEHTKVLCGEKDSPYYNVTVMPHLDHGDPESDKWALTEGTKYLASVMFDAQRFPFEENLKLTKEYVDTYGDEVLVEGIIDVLQVSDGTESKSGTDYAEKALRYKRETGVDFMVADLGTEQQSTSVGKAEYKKERTKILTEVLGKKMLVLHGTSCLSNEEINGLADDGVIRVNLWTKVARESGQYAAKQLMERYDKIVEGDFEATESRQYIYDSIDKSSEIMEELLGLFGYACLANNKDKESSDG
jgi:fructose/tagatose bisphosphate aldolase